MCRRVVIVSLLAVALGGAADRADAAPISSHAMVYTCCTATPMKDRIFAEAKASGAEFIRVDVELNGIFEGPGTRERPHWGGVDVIAELARRHDLKVLGIILGTPTWLSTCPERGEEAPLCPPKDPEEFGRLAAEVAEHARDDIVHWEILNEPDADWAFKGGPRDYARMLSAAHDRIKARVPEAKIVMGGVEMPEQHAWIRRVFATPGANAAEKFDIGNVHLRLRLRDVLPNLPADLRAWGLVLVAHGFRGPIWVTEHGYPADPQYQRDPAYVGGDPAQAAFLRDSIPMIVEAGADQVFVTLRDNLFGEYLTEGLIHIDESQPHFPAVRRPAFDVVRSLAPPPDEPPPATPEAGEHERLREHFDRLAAASRRAGHTLAAAIQDGAARGHELLAQQAER
jgi:hypothetical protein